MEKTKTINIEKIIRDEGIHLNRDLGCVIGSFNGYLIDTKDNRLAKDYKKMKNIRLTYEIDEPILDETEKRYLGGVIKPFRNKIVFIAKKGSSSSGKYFIDIRLENHDYSFLPLFEDKSMYKNMELNKNYTLEELGL